MIKKYHLSNCHKKGLMTNVSHLNCHTKREITSVSKKKKNEVNLN